MRQRNADNEASFHTRLAIAPTEMAHYQDYDYVIVNDDLKSATQQLQAIILADRCCLPGSTVDTRFSPKWMDGSMSEALALEGKTIVLGVSGSIAAFKAVEKVATLDEIGGQTW